MNDSKENQTKLFAADMWMFFNFGNPNERYQKFLNRSRPILKRFIEACILYPQVVIPTQDFMSLALLIDVLGENAIMDLFEANSLRFIRFNGSLAYIGNGGGIQSYGIYNEDEKDPSPFCAPVDTAIQWSLNGLKSKPKNPELIKLAIMSTQEVKAKEIVDMIRHETYMDILNSEQIKEVFAIRNTDMNHLKGIAPNQIRIYGGPDTDWKGDEIDLVMSLAATNLELSLAQTSQCYDLSTMSPIGHLLKAKAERSLKLDVIQSFCELREIDGIPDIGEAVLNKQIPLKKLLDLSKTRNGIEFQKWFHENCRKDPKSIAKEYISLLKSVPIIQSSTARIIRFIVTATIGVIPYAGQILGPIADALDSFFIEKWFKGYSPKYFIDNLDQLMCKKKQCLKTTVPCI